MKRFITVAKQHGEVVFALLGASFVKAAGNAAGNDAYQWLKTHLSYKNIPHNDQQAASEKHLPHQGGYVSFFIDGNGKWTRVDH